MSFALTVPQILAGTKSVTRRFGWWFLKPGDFVRPVRKCMGLKIGEKHEQLRGPLMVRSVRKEQLADITQEECALEGFPDLTPHLFICMLARQYRDPAISYRMVNRIEFAYDYEGRASSSGWPRT